MPIEFANKGYAPVADILLAARPGDSVTITTPQGSKLTGRVVMKFPTHLVLNLGGKYGTPGVATMDNIYSFKPKGGRATD